MTVSDACLDGLAAQIAAAYGIDFSGFRRETLADAVRARVGGAPDGCAGLLTAGPEALLPVVEAALNGETYFLRHGGHFDALRREILPRLYRARSSRRRLRVWSAGCSTGEEALSLAMVLLETAPDPDWDLQILATDLSREALRRAEAGAYGEWSFRGVPDGVRTQYFHRRGGTWHPASRLTDRIRYRHHNLVEGAPDRFDLVVCRNVLIYFQGAHLDRAAAAVADGVAKEGWLLTGPAEARPDLFPELRPVHLDDALLFCRARAGFLAPEAAPAAPRHRTRFTAAAPGAESADPAPGAEAAAPGPHAGPEATAAPGSPAAAGGVPLDARLERIRSLADRGDTEAAWTQVEEAAAHHRLSPELHLVRALVARARGDDAEALRAATAALFLDPGLALASVLAGDLLRATGDLGGAARAYRNAVAALAALPADAPVSQGDGITASALARLAERALAEVVRARGGTAA